MKEPSKETVEAAQKCTPVSHPQYEEVLTDNAHSYSLGNGVLI